ncbi:MAG: phospho-sugar mutase [Prevotellaceae bacterium]|jgi:phosphoglucomutase|nr:phospho-sugar mutase [Prevotellaceae bacterium]
MDPIIKQRIETWLTGSYDEETKAQVKALVDTNPRELEESFYKNLEFGTGGLRGIMGVGTNRMNKYTVGMATQGLANYLKKSFPDLPGIKVAITHDSRNNSAYFAQITAEVFAANGIKVFLFDGMRPTPELSFTIRHLGCQSGVVVTASHNPKEYNGYKAYWDDGAQVTSPHDTNIIAEVEKITDPAMVQFTGQGENIKRIGKEIDEIYLEKILSLALSPEAIQQNNQVRIVYTPLHGTGVVLIPEALRRKGFSNIIRVPEQDVSDGNFPTVESPNPEEHSAFKMAIEKATDSGADMIMASDPDADRVGLAIRNDKKEFFLLNGNQTASLLTYYLLRRWKELGKLTGKEYIIKTIVTTNLMKTLAERFGVEYYNVFTGFKFIAEVIREQEGKKVFIGGGEESYGYNIGEFVRDKDAVATCCTLAEMAAWAAAQGKTMFDVLLDIYAEYGYYRETLLSITKKGKDGLAQIQQMMVAFRDNPPQSIDGSKVACIHDYLKSESVDLLTGRRSPIRMQKSNVLQFITHDGTIVSVRPSGTEPKIKFYFGVRADLKDRAQFDKVTAELHAKFERIKQELRIG